MSVTIFNRADGFLIIETHDGQVVLDFPDDGEAVDDPFGTQPIPIILGPLPRPPLPMTVIKVKDRKHGWRARRAGVTVPRLDDAIEGGRLKPDVVAALSEAAGQLGGFEPVTVDAYLPVGYAIDAGLLSVHLGHVANDVRHPIVLSLWLKAVDG